MKFNKSKVLFSKDKDSNIIKSNKKSDNKNSVKDKSEVNSGRGIFFSKEKILFVVGLVMMVFSSCISVFAASFLYNSNEVSFNNSSSPSISSNNVQGAIDELYSAASDYSALQTRVAALEARWPSASESYFQRAGAGNQEWLQIKSTNSGNRGIGISDANSIMRGSIYYEPSTNKTNVVGYDSSGNAGRGTLNLSGNPVTVNGETLKVVKYEDRTFTNVAISTRSGNGAYYKCVAGYAPTGYTVASISLMAWQGAAAEVTPYYQDSAMCFMSDISQTVTSLSIRMILIKN